LRDQARPLSASQHLLHRSRSVGPAAARDMTLRGERLRYLPQRLALPMRGWIQRAVPLLPECSARPGGASTALLPQTRGRGRCRADAFDSAVGSVDAEGHLAYLRDRASKLLRFVARALQRPEPLAVRETRLPARRTAPRDRSVGNLDDDQSPKTLMVPFGRTSPVAAPRQRQQLRKIRLSGTVGRAVAAGRSCRTLSP